MPNLSKAQAERGIPAITAMRNLVESAAPPAAVDLPAWSKIRESILSQLDNQLRHAQMKLGRAEAPRPSRPSRPPQDRGGDRPRPRDGGHGGHGGGGRSSGGGGYRSGRY